MSGPEPDVTRREYKIPVESFERALLKMNFYKDKTTPMATHFRRADGLHVVLSSGRKEHGSVKKKTLLKVHKDDSLTHRVIMLDASERSKFLSQLTNLANSRSIDRPKQPCARREELEENFHQNTPFY